MSSSVSQGLQSCLEPRLIEPRVLRLKLAPPHLNFPRPSRRLSGSNSDPNNPKEKSHNEENTTTNSSSSKNNDNNKNKNSFDVSESKNNDNGDMGSWSFIQALTNNSQNSKEIVEENDKVYIHPLVKRSSSMLSEKSLEMCTESLGCETGSDISESSSDDIPSPPSESTNILIKQQSKLREIYSSKKLNRSRSFPPPLTSISGSAGCVQVRPHREGGRLVIKAVAVSPCNSYFHAERGDGRLRLCLFKDNNCGDFDYTTAEEREDMVEREESRMEDIEEDGVEGEEKEEEEEEEIDYGKEEEEEDDDEDDCDSVCCWGEEIDGNSENVGGEIGIEKLPRPSRCKEGHGNNKGLWNLETYNWVATS